jgi:DNA-binding XRE family transcriptional regulator
MKKIKRITLENVIQKNLKNPEFRFYFEKAKAVSNIALMVQTARKKAKLTQSELAARAKTTQAAIARLESGLDGRIPSLDLLERIACALKARLHVGFDFNQAA